MNSGKGGGHHPATPSRNLGLEVAKSVVLSEPDKTAAKKQILNLGSDCVARVGWGKSWMSGGKSGARPPAAPGRNLVSKVAELANLRALVLRTGGDHR